LAPDRRGTDRRAPKPLSAAERALLARPDAAHRVGLVLRVALLILVSLLIFTTTEFKPPGLIWPCLLAVAALPAWTPPRNAVMVPLGRLAEVAIVAIGASHLAVVHDPLTASALLPYLLVPVILPVLEGRMVESLTLLGIAALLLGVAGGASIHTDTGQRLLFEPQYGLASLEWLAIAGLSSAFVYSVQRRVTAPGDPGPQPYAEATRLLTQLRTVARQLPGATLDPGGLAEHLIEEVRAIAPLDRAVVLSGGGGGGRLVILAESAVERVDWETSLDADSAIADAWASQQPQVSNRSQARSRGRGEVSSLVVPLAAGVRTIGLIALEADQAGAYPPHLVARIHSLAAPAALRLEAALLFDDVRSLATNEERQRLAREIHDGVAQELVMVGYGIDNALATMPEDAKESAEELRTLRAEVTRVITELRLSLFELRTDVDRQGGLSAAIAEYARTIGAAGGLRVHFSLEESTARLPTAVEAELLRIAQEAITNARKHAGAQNLWVGCEIDPPYARIEVSDDGAGIAPQRPEGRFGLAIMAERAERIRGQLEITPRDSGGTTVAVVLGAPPRRSSV
jgi:signal transduction histidine kinase